MKRLRWIFETGSDEDRRVIQRIWLALLGLFVFAAWGYFLNFGNIPFDFHVMALEPDNIIPLLEPRPGDIVSIHYESTFQVQRTLERTRQYGCKVFVAINPATSLSSLDEIIHYVDGINLLMVNPGFAGQKIVPSTIKKAIKVISLLERVNREDIIVEVDGNITPENGKKLREIGATMFVCGTSSLFKGELSDYPNNIRQFRNYILVNE